MFPLSCTEAINRFVQHQETLAPESLADQALELLPAQLAHRIQIRLPLQQLAFAELKIRRHCSDYEQNKNHQWGQFFDKRRRRIEMRLILQDPCVDYEKNVSKSCQPHVDAPREPQQFIQDTSVSSRQLSRSFQFSLLCGHPNSSSTGTCPFSRSFVHHLEHRHFPLLSFDSVPETFLRVHAVTFNHGDDTHFAYLAQPLFPSARCAV